ncbi:MAG: glycosyltransferase family 9 protein [Candidatus Omnitrophica bacterium]|nr:glycosyltransferase family 9 protein [Candidatus Omnitrophota bacterium]
MNFKNILVVRTDRIGDVILTTPAFKALRLAYPEAKISLLVSSVTYPLVFQNPYVNEILMVDREGRHNGFWGFWKLVFEIRKRKFDLAVIYHTKRWTNWLVYFAGIPARCGYKDKHAGSLLTIPVEDHRYLGEVHESQYCLDLLKVLGVEQGDLELHISIDPAAQQWAEKFWKDKFKEGKKKVLFHVGASDPGKVWPAEYFVQLINMVKQEWNAVCVLVGNFEAQHKAEIIIKQCSDVVDLTSQTSVSQLVSLIKQSDILISNDSGPIHIAAALNAPVVAIFVRNQPGINPERWYPLGEKSLFIAPPKDMSVSFLKAGDGESVYLKKITPEEVFPIIKKLII